MECIPLSIVVYTITVCVCSRTFSSRLIMLTIVAVSFNLYQCIVEVRCRGINRTKMKLQAEELICLNKTAVYVTCKLWPQGKILMIEILRLFYKNSIITHPVRARYVIKYEFYYILQCKFIIHILIRWYNKELRLFYKTWKKGKSTHCQLVWCERIFVQLCVYKIVHNSQSIISLHFIFYLACMIDQEWYAPVFMCDFLLEIFN